MAITALDSLDSIGSAVDKINTISGHVGDLDTLENRTGSFVASANTYRETLVRFDDSAEQLAIARTALQTQDNGGAGSLTYNSSNGEISYTGQSASEARAHISTGDGLKINLGKIEIDSGQVVNVHFNGDAITGDLYDSTIETNIVNSAGIVIATLRTPEI